MRNKKRTGATSESSHGIGMVNSLQRLKSAYGDDGYSLDIKNEEHFYEITLTINDVNTIALPTMANDQQLTTA